VTTVTPSDRAGAASAKRSASIPTQRSGQALRLLVLGTGEGAAAFRERAAAAGAELAQRFSVRVTHVVAEDGIGEEDARVVRARTAGLPVLRLAEGARLLEDGADEGEASADAGSGAGAEIAVEEVDANGAVPAENFADGLVAAENVMSGTVAVETAETAETAEDVTDGNADADGDGDGDGDGATDGVADGGGLGAWADEVSSHRVQLVRPRNEFVPEPVEIAPIEVGPADVFTGSALEAVLLFPPLSVSGAVAEEDTEAESEAQDEGGFQSVFGMGADSGPSALMEVASGACECGDEGSELGLELDSNADTHVSVGLGVDSDGEMGLDSGPVALVGFDGEVEVLEVGVAAPEVADTRVASRTAASIAWALVPLVSLGLLTPIAMGYAAFRTRSRLLWIASTGYWLAMITAFTLSAASPLRTGSHAAVGELLTACLVSSWLGGTVHSFLIRRRVFG